MSSIETWLGAQPHILSVRGRAPRLLPCVNVREKKTEKGRKRDRESEVERLKSKRTWIGGDQWWCWTVERICVTAISKTITPAAPTVELIPFLLCAELRLNSFSENPPVPRRQTSADAGPKQQATNPDSRLQHNYSKTSWIFTGTQAATDRSLHSLWHLMDFRGNGVEWAETLGKEVFIK